MKTKLRLLFFGVVAVCFIGACASIMSGSEQSVTFTSDPEGATVTVNGNVVGKTPATIVLRREKKPIVEFTLEGYSKRTIPLDTRMNGWVLVNGIWCMSCVFSTTTDYQSGAAYEYSPNKYFVTLLPEGVTETPSDIKKRKVKSFIVGNYSSIIKPLSSESASSKYLNTLLTMLEIPKHDRKQARDKIKTISLRTSDAIMFADEVVNAFIVEVSQETL